MKRHTYIENKPSELSLIYDGDFEWKNVMNTSFCHLKVYRFGRKQIAVATEPFINTGASVTNGAEVLWLSIILKFGDCYCFETYDGVKFDGVEIVQGKATWYSGGTWEQVLESIK